jgi:hypothetical protein
MSFVIEIASVPDRDCVVAEIWWNDDMVAELYRNEHGSFQLEIYARNSGEPWSFELESWLVALTQAQQRLG